MVYSNGSTRPLLRGVLHGVTSVVLIIGLIYCVATLQTRDLEDQWWRFILLLIGKTTSYVSSSLFHLFPTELPETKAVLLQADLVTVSIAIWAPSGAFAIDYIEWNILFGIMLCATALNLVLVRRQLATPLKYPISRSILLLLYFIFTVAQIGWHYGYSGLWITGVVCYMGGFLIGPPLHHRYPPAFWHYPAWNGWHEDFHMLLGVADACFLTMAIQNLDKPTL